jgi:hypothetical protein
VNALACEQDVMASGVQARLALEPKTLLDAAEGPSPRLAWMRRNSLTTHFAAEFVGTEFNPWTCWSGELDEALDDDALGYGDSEHDALVSWALRNGVPDWRHEQLLRGGVAWEGRR